MNGCLDDEGPTVAALTLLGAAHAGCCTVLVSLVLNKGEADSKCSRSLSHSGLLA